MQWAGAYSPCREDLAATGAAQTALHDRARAATGQRFGRRVFIRAVVEISNFCREDCQYCGMRRSNRALSRYRARQEELAELLLHHRPAAVTDVNLQAGEDPVAVREIALPLVRTLRRQTRLGVSVCLGTIAADLCAALREAGASLYIIKFETADADHYRATQAPGSLEERLAAIHALAGAGWKVSSGFIAGLPGQDTAALARNCDLARRLPLHGCSVSPFVPGEDTPLAGAPAGGADATLNCMAVLRLMRPDWLIPAVSALNLADPVHGYRRGLRAGANLVTINLTPPPLQREYVLYRRDRFIMDEGRVLAALAAEGLEPSPVSIADFHRNGAAHKSFPASAIGPGRPPPCSAKSCS